MNDDPQLRSAAEAACRTWRAWQEADGWDNPEFDNLLDAMERLSVLTGVESLPDLV